MNLADALKKLYTKLGGTDVLPQGTDTCTLVDKIADEVSGGGSSGGGGSAYGLVVMINGDLNTYATLNKTYSEIKDAIHHGIMPLFISVVTHQEEEESVNVFNLAGISEIYGETTGSIDSCIVALGRVGLQKTFEFTATSVDGELALGENAPK